MHRYHRRHGLSEGDCPRNTGPGRGLPAGGQGEPGRLYQDVRDLFGGAEELGWDGVPYDCATTVNKGHGRIERRECWAISDPSCLGYLSAGGDWPGLCSVVRVVGRRDTGITVQPRYSISSLDVSAERLLEAVRAHWSIENSLHWSLDVTFREDQSRVRKDHSLQNMATLRQISHNQLKRETSLKVGIQGKRLQVSIASWNGPGCSKPELTHPSGSSESPGQG